LSSYCVTCITKDWGLPIFLIPSFYLPTTFLRHSFRSHDIPSIFPRHSYDVPTTFLATNIY
ncbi:MAG: hypothetical protein II728_08695, partial [Bacteroidaceae bacterium]|nr:hypothetical protein [Bacteroidaceae bacterium]